MLSKKYNPNLQMISQSSEYSDGPSQSRGLFYWDAGFTLIEVVVAVSVLTIGVLGVFGVVQNITFSFPMNSSKLTAIYLAQEGIELVRNQRDSNYLANSPWNQNLSNSTEPDILGKFDRTITIKDEVNKIVVEVEVSWQERGKNYSVSTQTELYDWY